MEKFKHTVLRDNRGMSLTGVVIAGALMTIIALSGLSLVQTSLKSQNLIELRNTRLHLLNTYVDILRTPAARLNSFSSANNPHLADHLNTLTPSPPDGLLLGTFIPDTNVYRFHLHDRNNKRVVPISGLLLNPYGSPCEPQCDETTASWRITAEWIALANHQIDTRIFVDAINEDKYNRQSLRDVYSTVSNQADDGDWIIQNTDIYRDFGRVGIGKSPSEKLDIAGGLRLEGQLYQDDVYVSGGTAIDWNNGNIQSTSQSCTNFSFSNIKNGGSYTLVVLGSAAGTCGFTHAGLSFKYQPPLAPVEAGKQTVFTFIRAGTNVYVSWIKGF